MDRLIGSLVFSDEAQEPLDFGATGPFEITEWNVLSLICPESANG